MGFAESWVLVTGFDVVYGFVLLNMRSLVFAGILGFWFGWEEWGGRWNLHLGFWLLCGTLSVFYLTLLGFFFLAQLKVCPLFWEFGFFPVLIGVPSSIPNWFCGFMDLAFVLVQIWWENKDCVCVYGVVWTCDPTLVWFLLRTFLYYAFDRISFMSKD